MFKGTIVILLGIGFFLAVPVEAAGTVLEIDTERNITINGIDGGDESGYGVASGDIDNDGVPDLIISARLADPGGRSATGETYVIFGPMSAGTLELSTAADITINGIDADDFAGLDVASGDLNNDGAADLVIGAQGADPGGRSLAGETYVLFGPLSAGTLELSTAADIVVNGIDAEDCSGTGVSTGDVNDDGVDDLIIGAPTADPGGRNAAGESYVLFGPLSAGTLELSTATDITVNGIDAVDAAGGDVSSGDVNNDGVADLVIGAPEADPGGRSLAGESYVLFGPLSAGTLELSTAADITINGVDAGDLSGHDVISGDVNNDGVADLVIGAPQADPAGRVGAGEIYELFGPLSAGTLELSTAADIIVNGVDTGDAAGVRVASGDVNNDGGTDLIIGAGVADPDGRSDDGETYVIFGDPASVAIPSVTQWGLIAMFMILAVGMYMARRRVAKQS